jgi:hypothetical protein
MQLVTVPTELTTAATDGFLALLALASAGYLYRSHRLDPWKILLWCGIMVLLALGSILGVLVHGFELAPTVHDVLWFPLYLSLALAVALFVVAAPYDGWGLSTSRRAVPLMLVAAGAFTLVAQLLVRDFLIFILYEGIAMLFALGVYLWLTIVRRSPGAFLITCGILVTILAALLQTIHSIAFTLIWQFNYNGLFHLIQLVGIVFLVAGVRKAVLAPAMRKTFSPVQPGVS